MKVFSLPPALSPSPRPLLFGCLLVVAASSLALTGCAPDETGGSSCQAHEDCEFGTVCGADETCIETDCKHCEEEENLICLENEEHPEGVCSVPECSSDEDCDGEGETCNQGRCIEEQCAGNSDCPAGQVCNVFGKCVEGTDAGPTDAGDATSDGDAGTEDTDTSMPDDVADSGGGGGDGGSCLDREECPPEADPEATEWSSEFCECVECNGDGDCDGDQECRNGVCKAECTQSCTQGGGSDQCPDAEPYCISDCCVECIGAADCDGDKICVDDQCTASADNCSPGECPTGYECNTDSGKCDETSSGQECDPQNPNSCPDGEFCDGGTCKTPSGGGSCGMCEADCTCPGNSTCSLNFVCTGCQSGSDCPDGQTCLFGFCFDPSM